KDAVAPAAVGVDIGCGMAAVKTSLVADKVERRLRALRSAIEEAIPVGFAMHEEPATGRIEDEELPYRVRALMARFGELSEKVQNLDGRAWRQVGTLGGGNHFIELCLDTEGGVWLMLHSGSRNVGKELAEIHIGLARKLAHNRELPDRDLAVFLAGTDEMAA